MLLFLLYVKCVCVYARIQAKLKPNMEQVLVSNVVH